MVLRVLRASYEVLGSPTTKYSRAVGGMMRNSSYLTRILIGFKGSKGFLGPYRLFNPWKTTNYSMEVIGIARNDEEFLKFY